MGPIFNFIKRYGKFAFLILLLISLYRIADIVMGVMANIFYLEKGYKIKVGKFPFSASGKASASGSKEGFVKVIFDEKYGEWLGCHMIGAGVTDMIAEAVLGRKLETTGTEVLKAIHPHPTMSEAVMEAVADAYDEVIHL